MVISDLELGLRVKGGLRRPDGIRIEGTESLFGYEGRRITLLRLVVYVWRSSGWLQICASAWSKKGIERLVDEEGQLVKWKYCLRLMGSIVIHPFFFGHLGMMNLQPFWRT